MPLIFSIGFVTEQRPKPMYSTICATITEANEIISIWRRNFGCDGMNCNCGSCIPRGLVCVPRGNSLKQAFRVVDQDGSAFDLTGVADITFTVSEGVMIGGTPYAGGSILFEKSLAGGGIVISGAGDAFVVSIDPADSSTPQRRMNYYEASVITGSGDIYTISAGTYQSDTTIIGGV